MDHLLAGARNEENRLVVSLLEGGPVVISGKGAGRWPTAESVIADIHDLFQIRRGTAA